MIQYFVEKRTRLVLYSVLAELTPTLRTTGLNYGTVHKVKTSTCTMSCHVDFKTEMHFFLLQGLHLG